MASTPKPRVIYWFRTDLRLHDSPALKAALDLNPEVLFPVWTWDPHYVYRARVGVNRWRFLIDCQNDLSKNLTRLNPTQKLLVLREAPQTLLPKLFQAWKITHLVFEKDTDSYALERDALVADLARKAGVEVISKAGRTLWDPEEIVKKNGGKPTMSISQLQAAGKKIGEVQRPILAPTSLPDVGDVTLDFVQEPPEGKPDLNGAFRERGDKSYISLSGPKQDFAPPTLDELGFPAATTPHRGGETLALSSLATLLNNETYIATFEKPKTAPTDFEPQSTTLLSPHLHFGSLSIRQFYWGVQSIIDKHKAKASQPPVSLIGQLLFRDMYFAAQFALGYSFSTAIGNSHCRFIPWHLPSLPPHSLSSLPLTSPQKPYKPTSSKAEEHLHRWTTGQTGFPWIDALMRQLCLEGWIHHLGRHAVACFLTRGGCYISWERGADVFEEMLIDHETASNVGNWQWLSCTAFYAQYYRVYSPIAFGAKTDAEGEFVRKYCPELKNLGRKWIYEPWKAPVGELKKAGVRLVEYGDSTGSSGVDGKGESTYPKPTFDFAEQRTKCLAGMKEAYAVGLYGDDPRVLDGSWKGLFENGGIGMLEDGVDGNGRPGISNGAVGKKEKKVDIKNLILGMGKGKGTMEVKKAKEVLKGSEDFLPTSSSTSNSMNMNMNGVDVGDGVIDEHQEDDEAVEEDATGAAEKGGESKGGDRVIPSKSQQQLRGKKRKAASAADIVVGMSGQGTLDGVFAKRVKK